jgi:demethylmenaquinone methyltransferase/2-methoxy-6-polyprenyl-1,4-benzoquinol methylase
MSSDLNRRGALFSKVASNYDSFLDLVTFGTYAKFLKQAVRVLAPVKEERVLDLGSGTGRAAFWISQLVGEHGVVVGMDKAEGMVDSAKKQYGGSKSLVFIKQDMTRTWSYRNPFDGIFLSFSLHELPESGRKRTLEQSCQALSEKGRIVIADFNPQITGWKRALLQGFFQIFERPNRSFLNFRQKEVLREIGFQRIKFAYVLGGLLQITLAYKT